MPINVGRMPYLNSELFYLQMSGTDFALTPLVPTAMARAADEGWLDAGPIPLVDCLRLGDKFERLDGYCIATRDKTRSIFLFSRRPWEELDGGTIGVTDETSTSVRLLQVLMAQRLRISPRYVSLTEPGDAMLLIGDSALRARNGVEGFPHVYDLGEEWRAWTGLPFVFALWVVRRDLPIRDKEMLREALAASLRGGLTNLQSAARRRADLGMSAVEVAAYLEGFSFQVGADEERAIAEFSRRMEALPPDIRSRELRPKGMEVAGASSDKAEG